jgi:hypothetical protein
MPHLRCAGFPSFFKQKQPSQFSTVRKDYCAKSVSSLSRSFLLFDLSKTLNAALQCAVLVFSVGHKRPCKSANLLYPHPLDFAISPLIFFNKLAIAAENRE